MHSHLKNIEQKCKLDATVTRIIVFAKNGLISSKLSVMSPKSGNVVNSKQKN